MISSLLPRLEHVGIAVADPAPVRTLYRRLLGALPYKVEEVQDQGVATHFIAAGAAKLELLEALHDDSPIARHVARRGEGLHHLAFEVADLTAHMERLREAGFRLLQDEPQPGADGKRIVFLHPKDTHGVLVEFCESQPALPPPTRVAVPGGSLAVYAWGSADRPPLVLLHGAAGSTPTETAVLARALAPYFHIAALDFAGHGASDVFPDDALTADRFVADVRAVMEAFGWPAAHAFGFSMGGYIAAELARRHPDQVERLAVHASNAFWDEALVAQMNARLQPDALPARVQAHLDHVHRDWRLLFDRMRTFVAGLPALSDVADRLQSIPQPTLVTAADQDDLFPLQAALDLHAHLPDSRLGVLPGTRHGIAHVSVPALAELLHAHFLPEAARSFG